MRASFGKFPDVRPPASGGGGGVGLLPIYANPNVVTVYNSGAVGTFPAQPTAPLASSGSLVYDPAKIFRCHFSGFFNAYTEAHACGFSFSTATSGRVALATYATTTFGSVGLSAVPFTGDLTIFPTNELGPNVWQCGLVYDIWIGNAHEHHSALGSELASLYTGGPYTLLIGVVVGGGDNRATLFELDAWST